MSAVAAAAWSMTVSLFFLGQGGAMAQFGLHSPPPLGGSGRGGPVDNFQPWVKKRKKKKRKKKKRKKIDGRKNTRKISPP